MKCYEVLIRHMRERFEGEFMSNWFCGWTVFFLSQYHSNVTFQEYLMQ